MTMSDEAQRLLASEIEKKKRELADLEHALSVLMGSSATNSASFKDVERSSKPRGKIKPKTIKADIMALLDNHHNGLTALEILSELRKNRSNLLRESLSPQLSRLKQSGWLVYNDGKWISKIREGKM